MTEEEKIRYVEEKLFDLFEVTGDSAFDENDSGLAFECYEEARTDHEEIIRFYLSDDDWKDDLDDIYLDIYSNLMTRIHEYSAEPVAETSLSVDWPV